MRPQSVSTDAPAHQRSSHAPLGVRGTVAGHRLGALEGGGGVPPFQCISAPPPPPQVGLSL